MINLTSYNNLSFESDETDVQKVTAGQSSLINDQPVVLSIDQHPKLIVERFCADDIRPNFNSNKKGNYNNSLVLPMTSQRSVSMAVDAEDVSYTYGFGRNCVYALKKVRMTVPNGQIYALLGASGCGKTTLLRCVLGRLKPVEGYIQVFGRQPGSKYSPVPGLGNGYMPQELALFPDFTIKETLRYFGQLFRMSSGEIIKRTAFLISLLRLPEESRLVCNLSGGQQRRVSLAAALVHQPPLLILDEPTVGVDPLLRKAIWDYLYDITTNNGVTVIITTHYIEEARTAETVGLMRFGRMLVQSNPDDLLKAHSLPTLEAVFLKLAQQDTGRSSIALNFDQNSDKNNNPGADKMMTISTIANQIEAMKESCSEQEKQDKEETKEVSLEIVSKEVVKKPEIITVDNGEPRSGFMTFKSLEQIKNVVTIPEGKRRSFDLRRIYALFIKNSIRILRNKPILLFYLFLPSIQISLFCLCIGRDPIKIPIAVYNEEDPPGLSAEYISFLDKDVVVPTNYDSLEAARQAVKDGQAWAALKFDANFSYALNQRRELGEHADNDTIWSSAIKLHMDMSNQIIGFVLIRTFYYAFRDFVQDYLVLFGYNPAAMTLPLVIHETVYGEVNPSVTDFMAPGVLLLISYYATTALTALCLVLERKDGLLERSLTAGVTSLEFLLSHIMTQTIVLTIQIIFMLFTTFYLFDVKSVGPMWLVFLLTFLQGVAGVMFGLFISSLCADEVSAAMLGMGSFFPTIILGGIFWPIQAMPDWIRWICSGLPQTLPVESLRFILSRGWSVERDEVLYGFIATFGWIVFYMLTATLIFKKYTTNK